MGFIAPRRLAGADHRKAVEFLLKWLEAQPVFASVKAAAHRVVHGMRHSEPELITPTLLAELRRMTPYEPVISPDIGRVKVRVIRTDEELMIARSVIRIRHIGSNGEPKS